MVDGELFSRIADKFFSITGAAWVAAMAFIAHLFRVRNERLRDIAAEKAGDWERVRDERDTAYSQRDVAYEERDLVRDRWAECEAEKLEALARAVTAEATLLGLGMGRNEAATQQAAERLSKPSDGNGGAK